MRVMSVADLTTTRDCLQPLCIDVAMPGLDHCRRHAAISDIRAANGDVPNGLAALQAMDAGLPQRTPPSSAVAKQEVPAHTPEPEEMPPMTDPAPKPRRGGARPSWTRASAIAAVQAFAQEHGRSPKAVEQGLKNGLPSSVLVRRWLGRFARGQRVPAVSAGKPRFGACRSEAETGGGRGGHPTASDRDCLGRP